LADAAGWIADQSGGWNSEATIAFLTHIAADWNFIDVDEIMVAAGYVARMAGGWGAKASIEFIAALMDSHDVPLKDMPYWLERMGLDPDGMEFADTIAKLILRAEGGGMPIDDIDDYLTRLGIVDTAIRRNITISLIYGMVVSGEMDTAGAADWAYVKVVAATVAEDFATARNLLLDAQALAYAFGFRNAYNLGQALSYNSPLAQAAGWIDPAVAGAAAEALWSRFSLPTTWFEKGGIATGPMSGYPVTLHGRELIIPMNDGLEVPLKWLGGGSTQAGANRGEEIALLKEEVHLLRTLVAKEDRDIILDGKVLGAFTEEKADGVIIQRNKSGNLNSTRRYYR